MKIASFHYAMMLIIQILLQCLKFVICLRGQQDRILTVTGCVYGTGKINFLLVLQ